MRQACARSSSAGSRVGRSAMNTSSWTAGSSPEQVPTPTAPAMRPGVPRRRRDSKQRPARAERRAILYERLVRSPEIHFEAGDHVARVHVSGTDFVKLMADAPRGQISRHFERGQRRRAGGIRSARPAAHRLMLNGYRVRCRSCHHFWTAVSMSIAQTASAVTSNPTTTAFVVGLAWSE
jgi:hypothetical protein